LPKVDNIEMQHLKMLTMHVLLAIDILVLLLVAVVAVVAVVSVPVVVVVVMMPVVQTVVVSDTDQRTEVDYLRISEFRSVELYQTESMHNQLTMAYRVR